jgi:V-type H+-transporting ATPase subunit E
MKSAGGVILSGHHGRITVDNTLDARLEIAKEEVTRLFILVLILT